PFIVISQIGFLLGMWLNHGWGFGLAALLSIPLGLAGLRWQQRDARRILRLFPHAGSSPLVVRMYTDSGGLPARVELTLLAQAAHLRTCLTRLQDNAQQLNRQAHKAHELAQGSSRGLEHQREETE